MLSTSSAVPSLSHDPALQYLSTATWTMDSHPGSLGPHPMSAIPRIEEHESLQHQQEEDDDDTISITSTVESESQDAYEVETIYTEFHFDDGVKYLVKWKGYPDVRCTWEPESSFDHPETILNWRKKKRAINRGEVPEFDLEAWENQIELLEDARDSRKRRRRAKRLRLGLSVTSDEDEPQHSTRETQVAEHQPRDTARPRPEPEPDTDASDDDVPLINHFGQARSPSGTSSSSVQPSRPITTQPELVSARVIRDNDSIMPQPPQARSKLRRNERQATAPRRPSSVAINPAKRRPAPVKAVSFGDSRGPAKRQDLASIVSRSRTSRVGTQSSHTSNDPKMWKLMSTAYKFDRASRIEPDPNPNDLELRRPTEWSPFQMSAALRRRNTSNQDSLFVEQDDDVRMDDAYTRPPVSQPGSSSMHRSTSADSLEMVTGPPAGPRALGDRDSELTGSVRMAKVGSKVREWNTGELLCQVSYGLEKVETGDVRLGGLTSEARKTLLSRKRAHRIDIYFSDLCSLDRFHFLTSETGSTSILFNGFLVGYPDTQLEVDKMGKLLRDQDLVAIFRVPGTSMWNRFTLLCYPAGSRSFGFLDRYSLHPPDGALHIAALRAVLPLETPSASQTRPGASTQASAAGHSTWRTTGLERSERSEWQARLAHPLQAEPSQIGGRHLLPRPSEAVNPSLAKSSSSRQDSRLPTVSRPVETNIPRPAETASSTTSLVTQLSPVGSKSPFMNVDRERLLKEFETSSATGDVMMADAPVDNMVQAPAGDYDSTNPRQIDLDVLFKNSWNMTFDELAALPSPARPKFASLFYLWFPDEAEDQYLLLKHFLDKHRVIVLSNRLSVDDWEKFSKSSEGVVLFYHTFINFQNLPKFARAARAANFSFWYVSLRTSIQYVSPPVNFQRIFPYGGGFLMTEDFMIHERDATIIILAWFRDWVKRKAHNTWKLMLRPRVLEWLRGKYDEDARFAVMDILIGDIVSEGDPKRWPRDAADLDSVMNPQIESPIISQSNFPRYGARQESDSAEIPKGLSQEERNTDHLCEWFAAWAIISAPSFRRFCILTSHPLQPRWQKWQHVELIRGPENFYRRENIDPRKYKRWLSQGDAQGKATVDGGGGSASD